MEQTAVLWLKFLLAVCIVAFGIGMGYFAAGKFRNRARFYSQWFEFNERYLTELDYARKPLSVLLKTYRGGGDFQKILDNFSSERKIRVKLNYLTEEERRECEEYFSMLGRGDARSQHDFFGIRRSTLVEKKGICAKQAKEKGELYLKLGLLAGLAFVILIV